MRSRPRGRSATRSSRRGRRRRVRSRAIRRAAPVRMRPTSRCSPRLNGGRSRGGAVSDSLWSERDATPSAISDALGTLLRGGHEDGSAHSPARALNLVVTVDGEWRGEVMNRLERVGRSHPSRTIVFAVDPAADTLDARVSISCATRSEHDAPAPCRERIEITVGPRHLPHLGSIAAPLLLSDLPTVIWSPHRHEEAIASLIALADAILVDSLEEPSVERAIRGARALTDRAHVVDLAWLRDAPWRERVAALFEAPEW